PVPFDSESVVYVWIDALINYVSAVGFAQDEALFQKWWPCDLHVIGKDITRFHCVIWPAMLMSAGVPLPRQVVGHGFVFFRGERMSKTLGTVVDPLDAAEKFGPDPLRLYLAREIAFGQDGDFSWERFEARYNADLANNLGNLVSRVTSMAAKYREGVLRSSGGPGGALRTKAEAVLDRYRRAMESLALQEGVGAAFELVGAVNEFITESEPWALAKDPSKADRLSQILYDVAEATRIAALLLLPVMPGSAKEISRRMGGGATMASPKLGSAVWGSAGELRIVPGPSLWPRLEGNPRAITRERSKW
ncbi:MAG: methionine--tRNA ligase, partial [Vicinamibacteria bacterium]